MADDEIILCNLSDANNIILEARSEWINNVFDILNIPDEVFNVNDIRSYRMNMEELGIEVILDSNGEVNVYRKVWHDDGFNAGWLPVTDKDLVAQWKTPERIMRTDDGKNVYYEIHLKSWSIKNISI